MKSRYLIPIFVMIVMGAIFVVGLGRDPTKLPSPFIGKAAPAMDLPDLFDDSVRISNKTFAGDMVLINFWATWCPGCFDEHDFLLELAASGVIPIYGINWRDNRTEAISWLQRLGDPFTANAFDGNNRTGIDWGVYGAPATFLIDAQGTVIYKHLGPLSRDSWQRDFVPILNARDTNAP